MKFRGKIDEKYLDEIRLSTIKTIYNFENDKQISDVLIHENLLLNTTTNCKDFYFSHTKNLLTDTEYNNFKKRGFITKKAHFLLPYNDVYNGAYLSRTQLILTFSHIAFGEPLYYNDMQILNYKDLFPFLDEYQKGFFQGFENFEDVFIIPKSSIFSNDESKLNLIFEYATNSWKMKQSFSYTSLNSDKTNLINGFESGLEVGYKYKSWSLILANSKLFENLFIEKNNTNKESNSTKSTPGFLTNKEPQQTNIELKKEPKRLAEKWYALLYWIELSANGQQPPRNSEGTFIKSEIEAIRKKITGKSGQSFYRSFISIDLNNERLLNNSFNNWKNVIIELSENNPKIIEYIQSKYTY